jgi:hypothetical protein
VRGIRGDCSEHLLQHCFQSLPLTPIEYGDGVAKNAAAGLQDPSCRGSPRVREDHRDRSVITACSPLCVAVGDELIDDTYRGGLRTAKRPSQLLDPKAGLLREDSQSGADGARVSGRRLHGARQRVRHGYYQRSQQVLQAAGRAQERCITHACNLAGLKSERSGGSPAACHEARPAFFLAVPGLFLAAPGLFLAARRRMLTLPERKWMVWALVTAAA